MLHTRAIIKARNQRDLFWTHTEDFGIPFTDHAKAKENPKVTSRISQLRRRYHIVEVDFRDT